MHMGEDHMFGIFEVESKVLIDNHQIRLETLHLQPSRFEKIFPGEKPPDPCLQGQGREGKGKNKGFLPLKEGES